MGLWLAVAGSLGLAAPARASSWEIEVSFGAATGSNFRRGAPFQYEGISFGGPYNRCLMPTALCALGPDLSDVGYSLFYDAAITLQADIEVRRRLGRSFSLGAGLMGGTSPRRDHLLAIDLSEVVYSRPPEPDGLRAFADEQPLGRGGFDALAYLHAGLRYERVLGPESTIYGGRRRWAGVFIEGGGGAVPVFPGSRKAGFEQTVAAVHASLGVRFHRAGLGRDLSVTVTHMRCLVGTDHLQSGRFAWTGIRLGFFLTR
jgi:hypothetical protein